MGVLPPVMKSTSFFLDFSGWRFGIDTHESASATGNFYTWFVDYCNVKTKVPQYRVVNGQFLRSFDVPSDSI